MVRLRVDEADLVGHAELGDQLVDAVHLGGALGAAGPADHHERGVGPAERGQGPHRDVEALERLDAADEQEHRAVAEVEVAPARRGRPARSPGEKKAWSTPGGTSSMRVGIGAVEPHELVGLGDARRRGWRRSSR